MTNPRTTTRRPHSPARDDATSQPVPVIQTLNREWVDLVATGAFAEESDTWLQRWPALRPYFQPATGPSTRLDRTSADEVLGALLAEHAAGSYAAGRTVLQCMLGSTITIAQRCRARHATLDEAFAETVAAMWTAISTYPLERSGPVATRLHFATLDAVAGRQVRKTHEHEVPLPDEILTAQMARSHVDPCEHTLGSIGEALEVVAWGVDVQAITPAEASLITRLYISDADSPTDARSLAVELDITHAALRKRAHRAVRRLAQAVHDDQAA
ncbi:hypothetical protein [uncultured Cellulomonas sp.]|uniref:hypothetical protein n=1 Tax=uncultured Cellulomonas sp. TaxID=189682 RepID=UPI0026304E08|nr:hypothetical protein [uncultured Cellulomonas sp.]